MATTSYTSWAADLAEVGAVYPFVGSEVVMVILGVVFWLLIHENLTNRLLIVYLSI